MMKRGVPFLSGLMLCMSISLAGYSDGFITAGEYEYGDVIWRTYDPPLIVNGGGAERISVRDGGRLIVQSTSTPLVVPWDVHPRGVYDILLGNNAQLLYMDGVTEFIGMGGNASAVLTGGNINYIKAVYYVPADHVFIHCQDGWSWISNNPLLGIQGLWNDGTSFRIEFINDTTYAPTWMNVEVITPEPATLLLLGVGALMLRRRKA